MTEATGEASSTPPRGPVIELRDICMQFRQHSVLRNLTLVVERGQTVCVIGESGCGKTVLLKLMIGLLRPTQGVVKFEAATSTR
jgi:phospholipid/cholesterol/gamma-HCH transport system ATP-binding protein